MTFSPDEKKERIIYLENSITALKDKIADLKQSFPFNVKELIFNEERILQRQDELRDQIKTFEEEIMKYLNMITIMTDE